MRAARIKDKELSALESLLGRENVAADEKGRIRTVPSSPVEMSALMRFCRTYRLPARVGYGGFGGQAPGLYISLERFDSVDDFDPNSMLAKVGAATKGRQLIDWAAAAGLEPTFHIAPDDRMGTYLARSPVSPTAWSAGHSEPCVSVHAVLADGTEVNTRETPRSAAGPDIKHLLLGTRGAIGILLSAVVRLAPRDIAKAHLCWKFNDRRSAGMAAQEMYETAAIWPGAARLVQDEDRYYLFTRLRGDRAVVESAARRASETASRFGGRQVGPEELPVEEPIGTEAVFDGGSLRRLVSKVKGIIDPLGLLNPGELS